MAANNRLGGSTRVKFRVLSRLLCSSSVLVLEASVEDVNVFGLFVCDLVREFERIYKFNSTQSSIKMSPWGTA